MNEYLAARFDLKRGTGDLGKRVQRWRAALTALEAQGWHGYCGLIGCSR